MPSSSHTKKMLESDEEYKKGVLDPRRERALCKKYNNAITTGY